MNIELMKRVRDQITQRPETHDQNHWGRRTECGTTHCVAGWACVLSNVELDWDTYTDDNDTGFSYGTSDGISIDKVARSLLRLNNDQADQLFWADNDNAANLLNEWIESA